MTPYTLIGGLMTTSGSLYVPARNTLRMYTHNVRSDVHTELLYMHALRYLLLLRRGGAEG
jgi:hypothetical protein